MVRVARLGRGCQEKHQNCLGAQGHNTKRQDAARQIRIKAVVSTQKSQAEGKQSGKKENQGPPKPPCVRSGLHLGGIQAFNPPNRESQE